MREAAFVKSNLKKWEEFEKLVSNPHKTNPDRLSDLFIQLTDDLAYAKTNYPKSKTTQYLNGLASKVHQGIYRNKKEEGNRFKKFWLYEVPEVMYHGRKYLLYSFLIFAGAAVLGVFSSTRDELFARLILGDGYVNMTISNIESGNPMGVYGFMPPFTMFLYIFFNNIRVSFFAFASGIFFSLGTIYLLFNNGLMLGVFQYLFVEYDLGYYSFLSIWVHGTLEIAAIVIAGAAGFMMGHGIVFPGTYSRMRSFRQGAKNGIKVIMALIPVFFMAAVLESWVTRHTELPDALQLGIILISAFFIIGYFIIYPYRLYHGTVQQDPTFQTA